MKGGIGTSSIALPNGIVVGALVAVNCVGDVVDPKTGVTIAGALRADGKGFLNIIETYRLGLHMVHRRFPGENTTIGVIATNVALTKTQMTKIAEMGHDGVARTINPAHTPLDGDTLFAITTSRLNINVDHGVIGALAAEAVSEAIIRAVTKAKSVEGIPSYGDV